MQRYEKNDYAGARIWFRKLARTKSPDAENAQFFYAASFFREADWVRTRHEFKRLLARFPKGRWVPAAHWHIAMCDKYLGRVARARRRFAMIVRRYPNDPSTVAMASTELTALVRRRGGVLVDWWRGWRSPRG
jgi:TolA-binding protein